MAKRITLEQKREKAVIDLINKMFEISGHSVTYDDIKDRKDNWFWDWEMTVSQADEWKEWGIQYLRKELRMNINSAKREMEWVNLQWGLKYSDWENYGTKFIKDGESH
jgi:hypothetical protein